jgi:hypothetical protein
MSQDFTKIELAKALKAIKAISTNDQFEKVKKIYIQEENEESVLSAINGLSEEDEFAMLTKLMGTATHIIGLEQRPIIEGDYIVPDFFVNFRFGCSLKGKSSMDFLGFKCLIEVKSTQENVFKIGGSKLKKLRNFSDILGFPLIFAVRFLKVNKHALWAIVEDNNRIVSSLNVNIQDVVDGVRKIIWDEYILTLNQNLIVICEFSKSSKNKSVIHPQYGTQIGAIFTDGKNTLKQTENAFITCSLLEAYDLEEIKVEKITEDITCQYLKPKILPAFLGDLVYKMNNIIVDEFGMTTYNASKLLVRSDTGAHDTLANRKMIEFFVKPLFEKHLIFLGSIGNIEDHYRKWLEFGGK